MPSTLVTINGADILVEIDEPGATVARQGGNNSYEIEGLEPTGVAQQIVDAGSDIRTIINAVTGSIQQAFDESKPEEWSVELLIGFKGEAGVPFVTKGEANASLKLTAKWKKA